MDRRTAIVSGALGFKIRRHQAAVDGELGLEILTLPQLAARLAGGFIRPAGLDVLEPLVQAALAEGGFHDLQGVQSLPGTGRAAIRTLESVWRSGVSLQDRAAGSPRLADLLLLETRIRQALPTALLIPPDLRDRAMARADVAPAVFGTILIEDCLDIDPVWRPLIVSLSERTPVSWRPVGQIDRSWFPGELELRPSREASAVAAEICADPRAEVVEALRWARSLLAAGVISASDIAITAASPEAWDEQMLVLARQAGLPLHFSHGVPALNTYEGQACASLADILLRGISQPRLRRLFRRSPPTNLPADWATGLRRSAGLFTEAHWHQALLVARPLRVSGETAEQIVGPILTLLAGGTGAAERAGEILLRDVALQLWRRALRAAPAEAIELSLGGLKAPDATPPATSVVWGPASHVATMSRRHVRLLGLTGRSWPRATSEDPLLPHHIQPREEIEPIARPEMDEIIYRAVVSAADGEAVVSRSRRSATGQSVPASRLWPKTGERVLARTRVPIHAFSASDRLLARPSEAVATPWMALSRSCWLNWNSSDLTDHDGVIPKDHAVVKLALSRLQSTTSLKRLLRDPLGYVWQYGLGWRPNQQGVDRLSMDPATFGDLVHDLLKRSVDRLEPDPGLAKANEVELEDAIQAAADEVGEAWPLERALPPPLLWKMTVDKAASLALAGLKFDDTFRPGTRSWTELTFGDVEAPSDEQPWDRSRPLELAGHRIGGRIDRLDLQATGVAVRVTDYKTSEPPSRLDRLRLGRGSELQRVIYAAATRQLLPEAQQIVSRLVFLADQPSVATLPPDDVDDAISVLAKFIVAASGLLESGKAPPGPDADDKFNDLRLALPADLVGYRKSKALVFNTASNELSPLWSQP